jgi:hypothetical protein
MTKTQPQRMTKTLLPTGTKTKADMSFSEWDQNEVVARYLRSDLSHCCRTSAGFHCRGPLEGSAAEGVCERARLRDKVKD